MANPSPPSNTPTVSNLYQQPPTLYQIQQKVRRLTRTPSTAQLSDDDLNNYINTFVIYDFPEILRTFNLKTEFSFYTNAGQDTYNTDILSFAGATNNPLYNFQNKYLTVSGPMYIAGFQAHYFQSPEQFYAVYPKINSIQLIGNGTGTSGPFTGFINSNQAILPPPVTGFTQQISLLQNNVLFSSLGTIAPTPPETVPFVIAQTLVDVPVVDPTTGFKTQFGNLYDPNTAAYNDPVTGALTVPPTVINQNNNINYYTGKYTINFTLPTLVGTPIQSQSVPQALALPQSIMFYSNEFTIRPVPHAAHKVNFEVFQRPTALLDAPVGNSITPALEEYWQYISYGAAMKIFQDRMDLDSVQLIAPEFRRQETMCLRRTLVQNATQRATTIYDYEQRGNGNGNNGGWGSGSGAF
jgi:hypothetical protein